MFNAEAKRNAIANLTKVGAKYELRAAETQKHALDLFELRRATSEESVGSVETYINRLAHTPKQFIKVVSEYKVEVEKFNQFIDQVIFEARQASFKGGSMAGAAIGAGAAFATFAPTAALALATTFGTASTGAAISALTGAAATSASLAWLGGGVLAVGGGGVAAGEAILILAGPVGWAIGGLALVGGGLWMRGKNAQIASDALTQSGVIEGKNKALLVAQNEIFEIVSVTKTHAAGLLEQLSWLLENSPMDYNEFTNEQQHNLASLVNNVESLSILLNKKII